VDEPCGHLRLHDAEESLGAVVPKPGGWRFDPHGKLQGGEFRFFAPPPDDCHSVCGLDTSKGILTGENTDWDAAIGLDARGRQLWTLHGKWGDAFGSVLWPVVQWYKPFVVGERQEQGLATLRFLYDRGHSWLYRNRAEETRGRIIRDCLGHSKHAGDLTIPRLQQYISPKDENGTLRPPLVEIYDPAVWHELSVFQHLPRSEAKSLNEVRDRQMVYSAPSGEHDDLVLALAYACMGIEFLPQFPKPVERVDPLSMGGLFGTPESIAAEKATKRTHAFRPVGGGTRPAKRPYGS
jgi:hypothetical protein